MLARDRPPRVVIGMSAGLSFRELVVCRCLTIGKETGEGRFREGGSSTDERRFGRVLPWPCLAAACAVIDCTAEAEARSAEGGKGHEGSDP